MAGLGRGTRGSQREGTAAARRDQQVDHMQGTRFRHAAKFLRWRPDKRPQDCRYDQLEVTPAYELDGVFGARDRTQPCAPASQGS